MSLCTAKAGDRLASVGMPGVTLNEISFDGSAPFGFTMESACVPVSTAASGRLTVTVVSFAPVGVSGVALPLKRTRMAVSGGRRFPAVSVTTTVCPWAPPRGEASRRMAWFESTRNDQAPEAPTG